MSKEPMYKEGDIVCWHYHVGDFIGSDWGSIWFYQPFEKVEMFKGWHVWADPIAYWRIKKLK